MADIQTAKRLHTPYNGFVKALEKVHYGHLREEGDVFEVQDLKLWNDDPFTAVKPRKLESGETVYEPYAEGQGPSVGDFKSRKPIVDNFDSTARRAATV